MKQRLLKVTSVFIFSMVSMHLLAYDFQSNGIYYTILSESEGTVEVSRNESSPYSGNIIIPEKVTKYGQNYDVVSIGKWAFLRCGGLVSVTIPSTISNIGKEAFAITDCLQNVIVDDNNNYYTSIDGVLIQRNGTLIVYPAGKTNDIYAIPDMVTVISSRAFQLCNSLIEVNMKNVLKIEDNAFELCENLSKITLSESLEYIGDQAFSSLKINSITLPESLRHIGSDAFNGCHNLRTINIPRNVEFIGEEAIGWCDGLESICVDENNDYYASINGVLYDKEIKTLLRCPSSIKDVEWFEIPQTVTTIAYCAFHTNYNITRITIPSGVTTIGNAAFYYCSNLSRVTCYAQTPPTTPNREYSSSDPWEYSGRSNATLYVPKGSKELYLSYYRNDPYGFGYPWAEFKAIIEMEEGSGINDLYNTQEQPLYYNIYGIPKTAPSKGINLIRKNNKIKKVVYK